MQGISVIGKCGCWLAVAVCLIVVAGCGVPLRRISIDHVHAVGWLDNEHPVALAREMSFVEAWLLAGPDGGGKKQRVDRGPVLLLTPNDRTRVEMSQYGSGPDFHIDQARWRPDDNSFIAVLKVESSWPFDDEHAVTIGLDGRVDEFYLESHHAEYRISPDSRRLYRYIPKATADQPRYASISIPSGFIRAEEVDTSDALSLCRFQRFSEPRVAGWVPCDPVYQGTLVEPAHRRELVAVSCEDADSVRLWLITAAQDCLQLASIPVSPRERPAVETDRLEDLAARYVYTHHVLSWSPDDSRLYFCQGEGAPGVVIDLGGNVIARRESGLLQAAWSPDGTRLAGMEDGQLVIWTPDVRNGK